MKTLPWTDPIVDEIHEIREQMAKEAGYDIHVLAERIRESYKLRMEQLGMLPPQDAEQQPPTQ